MERIIKVLILLQACLLNYAFAQEDNLENSTLSPENTPKLSIDNREKGPFGKFQDLDKKDQNIFIKIKNKISKKDKEEIKLIPLNTLLKEIKINVIIENKAFITNKNITVNLYDTIKLTKDRKIMISAIKNNYILVKDLANNEYQYIKF